MDLDRPQTPIKLSICIPTYNFGEFIGETLDSILPQLVDGVEIVILDGGSTDCTPAVVEAFQRRCPALRFHRREERGGIDRDMARTVALARGDYCWLFSSDDLMRRGALGEVLAHVESGLDVYLCGFTLCTCEMRPLKPQPILDVPSGMTFDLARDDDRRIYFEHAASTTAFFSFLGSVIFKKARWNALELDERFVGSCWAHVARMFSMIPAGLRIEYLAAPYLWKRCDNDSFMDAGLIRRFAITIDGYHRLARTFFPEDGFEARHIRRAVAAEFPPYVLLYTKWASRDASFDDRLLLDRLAETVYSDESVRSWLCRALYRNASATAFPPLASRG